MNEYKSLTLKGFKPHFKALHRIAYFRNLQKPLFGIQKILYSWYQMIVWTLVLTYNLQHVIRLIQVRHSTTQIVDILFVLLTTLNCLGKQLTFNMRRTRMKKLFSILGGNLFAPNNLHHEEILNKNAEMMSRLLTLYHCSIFTCGTLWAIYPVVNRFLGEDVKFTAYFPLDVSKTPAFEIGVVYMTFMITFQAYGHVTMDCMIASIYAQGKAQLRMLRHNLENIADGYHDIVEIDNIPNRSRSNTHIYKDKGPCRYSPNVRLARCVEHYREIVWFIRETESIFSEAMLFHFFVMAWINCMTVYKMVGLSIMSAEFFSMAVYLLCMLAQLFLYCYYGEEVKVESNLVSESVYCCDWLSLSPSFRKMLVTVQTCSRIIQLHIAYVISLSLNTYITVLKFSYTLFTVFSHK